MKSVGYIGTHFFESNVLQNTDIMSTLAPTAKILNIELKIYKKI